MTKLLKTKKDKEQFMTWLAFLESGVFRQGIGALQPEDNSYCCLGVGCILFISEKKVEKRAKGGLLGHCPRYQQFAPDWLKEINGEVGRRTRSSLIDRNDNLNHSFKKIAKDMYEIFKDELEK